jgi:putative transposase
MRKSKYTDEQVAYAIRQVEGGTLVADVCRRLSISEQTFYRWKRRYASLGVTEMRRLRVLEDENRKLKQFVADLSLDKHMLHEVIACGARAGRSTTNGSTTSTSSKGSAFDSKCVRNASARRVELARAHGST